MENAVFQLGIEEVCEAIANHESCGGLEYVELLKMATYSADAVDRLWSVWGIDIFALV